MNLPDILKQLGHTGGKIIREINVVPRVLSETDGTIEYVASDETLDCYGEIVRVNGWQFTHFTKNAPFVNSHDYSDIRQLLGRVESFEVKEGKLVEVVKYSRIEGTLAEWAFKMVRDGFLKAVSVGFVPVAMASKWDGDQSGYLAQIAELKLDAETAGKLRAVYKRQEQIELSQCIIGANPNALAKSYRQIAAAYKGGCLTEADIEKLSAQIATDNNATTTQQPALVEAARRRAQISILTEIQRQF